MNKNKRNLILENKKLAQHTKDTIAFLPRCYWSKETKKQSASVLVKCGDCNNTVKIYYDKNCKIMRDIVEINGVIADKLWWKELFKEIGIIE